MGASSAASVAALALISAALIVAYASRTPSSAEHQLPSLEHIRRRHLQRKLAAQASSVTTSPESSADATPVPEQSVITAVLERSAQLISREDILQRVPSGGLAFFTLANDAYADLAINWALLIKPVLATVNASEHYFIGALDKSISAKLLERRLPTLRVGLSGAHESAVDAPSGNFRLKFSQFRAYGVTKADLLVWLLRNDRHVVVSDVDCAWLSPPHYLLASLAEADVMAGTDCLHRDSDDDRSARGQVEPRCGHHPGSPWAAWFNTGVLLFRATAGAISFAEKWRDRMAEVQGDGTWGNQVDDQLTFNQVSLPLRVPLRVPLLDPRECCGRPRWPLLA